MLEAGLYWEWMLDRGRAHSSRPGLHLFELRFEALVLRPIETLTRLAPSSITTSITRGSARTCATRVGTVARPNTSFPAGGGPAFNPLGRWRARLDRAALARLEAAIQRELCLSGYKLASQTVERQMEVPAVARARRRARWRFSSRHFLKTRTPLGRVFTNPALLPDFHAFDRERLMPAERNQTA